MPILKFKIKGVEFEYVGDQGEIISFVNRFLGGSVALPVKPERSSSAISPSVIVSAESEDLVDLPAPSDKEVVAYVTSKPEFRHTLFDVQKQFFGTTFKSRGKTKRMYHRTARQLRAIRELIEKEFEGKFVETLGAKGLKEFVFKKSYTKSGWGDIKKSQSS